MYVNDLSIPPMRSGNLILLVGATKVNRLLYDHVITKMKYDQVQRTLLRLSNNAHWAYRVIFNIHINTLSPKMRELLRPLKIH